MNKHTIQIILMIIALGIVINLLFGGSSGDYPENWPDECFEYCDEKYSNSDAYEACVSQCIK